MEMLIEKIVSGGQTGVDRAALDAAIAVEMPHGGWCPQGRRSEDGRIDECYALQESHSRDYSVRTEQNVLDSNGTLIFHRGPLSGGTRLTRNLARRHQKPYVQIDLNGDLDLQLHAVIGWLESNEIRVLNVAGPRESSSPGIQNTAREVMVELLDRCSQSPSATDREAATAGESSQ